MNDAQPSAPADTSTIEAEPDMMAIAIAADNGTYAPPTEKPAVTPSEKPADAPAENGTPAGQGDDAKPKPGETPAAKPEEGKETPKPGEKPETPFTKAQKEAARQKKTWQDLERDKAEFRQERGQLQTQVQTLTQQVNELTARLQAKPAEPAKDAIGIDANTYEALAKKYEEEGKTGDAQMCRERADALRKQAPAASAPAAAAVPPGEVWKTPEFQRDWKAATEALVASDPTLADPKNPVVIAANNLINDKAWGAFFRARPDGIRAAVEVGKIIRQAQQSESLRKELTTVKAEVERLTKLTQPQGSLPTSNQPLPAKRVEDMSADEMDAEVRRIAQAADTGQLPP